MSWGLSSLFAYFIIAVVIELLQKILIALFVFGAIGVVVFLVASSWLADKAISAAYRSHSDPKSGQKIARQPAGDMRKEQRRNSWTHTLGIEHDNQVVESPSRGVVQVEPDQLSEQEHDDNQGPPNRTLLSSLDVLPPPNDANDNTEQLSEDPLQGTSPCDEDTVLAYPKPPPTNPSYKPSCLEEDDTNTPRNTEDSHKENQTAASSTLDAENLPHRDHSLFFTSSLASWLGLGILYVVLLTACILSEEDAPETFNEARNCLWNFAVEDTVVSHPTASSGDWWSLVEDVEALISGTFWEDYDKVLLGVQSFVESQK